jgi:hypothetical protein
LLFLYRLVYAISEQTPGYTLRATSKEYRRNEGVAQQRLSKLPPFFSHSSIVIPVILIADVPSSRICIWMKPGHKSFQIRRRQDHCII